MGSEDPTLGAGLPCADVECQNNGTCFQSGEGTQYVCFCVVGFTGQHCETVVTTPTVTMTPPPTDAPYTTAPVSTGKRFQTM